MIMRNALLGAALVAGTLVGAGKHAGAATCSFENYDELSYSDGQKVLNSCLANWDSPKISIVNFHEWGAWNKGDTGAYGVMEYALHEDVETQIGFIYDMSVHSFQTSLDGMLPGTGISSLSFTFSATPHAPLFVEVFLDSSKFGQAVKYVPFQSVTLSFALEEEITWLGALNGKDFFLSYFSYLNPEFPLSIWAPLDGLGTTARLTSFVAVVPVPLPPAIGFLLLALASFWCVGSRRSFPVREVA